MRLQSWHGSRKSLWVWRPLGTCGSSTSLPMLWNLAQESSSVSTLAATWRSPQAWVRPKKGWTKWLSDLCFFRFFNNDTLEEMPMVSVSSSRGMWWMTGPWFAPWSRPPTVLRRWSWAWLIWFAIPRGSMVLPRCVWLTIPWRRRCRFHWFKKTLLKFYPCKSLQHYFGYHPLKYGWLWFHVDWCQNSATFPG